MPLRALAIASPLILFCIWVLFRRAIGRPLTRFALNVQSSVLLLLYYAGTAALGIFWVANQQLPAFDLHYLFGYATVVLVAIHLVFNFRVVWRAIVRPPRERETSAPGGSRWSVALGSIALLAIGFFFGTRHAKSEVRVAWSGARAIAADVGPIGVIDEYHRVSSHTRTDVLTRAPSLGFDEPPAFKEYPTSLTRTRLPEPDATPSISLSSGFVREPSPVPPAPMDLVALATSLHFAARVTGDRGGLNLRATPSSGGLFASELYVSNRSIAGLPSGLYHYDPLAHTLVRIGEAADAHAIGALGSTAAAAPAFLFVTAMFRRTEFKYRDRAYRYILADAGHLLENLRLAALSSGRFATPIPRFDESATDRALHVDGIDESTIAIAALGASSPRPEFQPIRALEPSPPPDNSTSQIGIHRVVHAATGLRARAIPSESRRAGPAIQLPDPSRGSMDVRDTMSRRRSVRVYSDRAMELSDLSGLLVDAFSPHVYGSNAVRALVIANRVAGLERGAYRFDPAHRTLIRMRTGDLHDEAQAAALDQEVIGNGAAVLILAIDRAAMRDESGARGYRLAFLEAGMMGERWLLGAVARGLGACPVGAFYDAEAAALVGTDMAHEWVVHFAAAGIP